MAVGAAPPSLASDWSASHAQTIALSELDMSEISGSTTPKQSTSRPDFRRVASEDGTSTLAPTASFKTWSVTSTEPGQGPFHLEHAARSASSSIASARETFFQPSGLAPPVPPLPDDYIASSSHRFSAVSDADSTVAIPPNQIPPPPRSQTRIARSGHVRRPSSPRDLHHDDATASTRFEPTHTRQSSSQRSLDWLLPPGYTAPSNTVRTAPAPAPTVAGMTESTSWSKAFAAGLDAPPRKSSGRNKAELSLPLPASHDIERRMVEGRDGWACCGDRSRRARPQQRRRWLLIGARGRYPDSR